MRKTKLTEYMREYLYILLGTVIGAVLAMFVSDYAFGQDKSRMKPAENLIRNPQGRSIQIRIPIVGLGIIILGTWATITGRINWMRMVMIAMAGGL